MPIRVSRSAGISAANLALAIGRRERDIQRSFP
jgi:hypothetical protein